MSITYEKSPEGKLRMLIVDSKIQDITVKELKAEKAKLQALVDAYKAKIDVINIQIQEAKSLGVKDEN